MSQHARHKFKRLFCNIKPVITVGFKGLKFSTKSVSKIYIDAINKYLITEILNM